MPTHHFWIQLSKEKWMSYYRGVTRSILVQSIQGLRISIPAHHFRTYTNHNGLKGFFVLVLDDKNRVVSLRRISDGTS